MYVKSLSRGGTSDNKFFFFNFTRLLLHSFMAQCDISSWDFSMPRLIPFFFESIGIGLKNFGLGKKVSVSVSIILVSKKVSVSVSKILVSKKVSVSVSMKILVSALSDLWALAISFGSRRTSYWFSRIKVHKEQSHRATITSWICVQWTLFIAFLALSCLNRLINLVVRWEYRRIKMTTSEKLCLQWNEFQNIVIGAFDNLRNDRDLTDVTLACEDGKQIETHKIILAATSPFFLDILKRNKHPHPLRLPQS